jgi:hypothetical protein
MIKGGRQSVLWLLGMVLLACPPGYGMATEQIGPDTRHPTVSQPDWPKGIVAIPRLPSRVYSIWVNGNETFYFMADPNEVDGMLALFAGTRMRDHIVQIRPGTGTVRSFDGREIQYNASLQIVAGLVRFVAREEQRDDLPLEPELTLYAGQDASWLDQLNWPSKLIVESGIPGLSPGTGRARPERRIHYGRLVFEDGSPLVRFVRSVNSRITLWGQDETDGVDVASVNNQGRFAVRLSAEELAALRSGSTWLTVTIGNFLVEPCRTDPCFPVESLASTEEEAEAVPVSPPTYYFGRILFEDGCPPVLDPPPWPGAEIRVGFPYAGMVSIDSEGYFQVSFSREQLAKLREGKPRRNIYVPDGFHQGRSSANVVYPARLLSTDKAKAGVVRIPRPELPRPALASAEPRVGRPIPGFQAMHFDEFDVKHTAGRPLAICFWDVEQRSSRQCVRALQKHEDELRERGVAILAIHINPDRQHRAVDWLEQNHITLTSGMIQGDVHETRLSWGAKGSPWLILTNTEHIVTKEGFRLEDLLTKGDSN